MEGLNWQTFTLPLAAGLAQKSDDRARQPPSLDICKDVRFDELGGIRVRKKSTQIAASFGDGAARKVVANGDELLLFTKDALWSLSEQTNEWTSKGTHLAVKVREESRFVTTGEQHDPDRAELSNTIVYAWEDNSVVWVAAVDKATGAVTVPQTSMGATTSRPRLVAIATRILLFYVDSIGRVVGKAIDPAAPAAGIAGAATVIVVANSYYDVCRRLGSDEVLMGARLNPTTSYWVGRITASLATSTATKARTCDGPIAVSSTPDGAQLQVVRGDGFNVLGDLITASTLADVGGPPFVNATIGLAASTPINQIAAAHRSVQVSGQYRCHVFWSAAETTAANQFQIETNWVDTAATLGTQSAMVLRLGVASRAFDHEGRVYLWTAFSGESTAAPGIRAQLQNSYFLYRDDGFLVAKAAFGVGGGFAYSTGRLPGVALVDGTTGYAWCGTERRVIEFGSGGSRDHKGYAARAPRDIRFTFDSDEARRCARLGSTLYVAGGEVLQYDGEGLAEVGFHIYPWAIGILVPGAGSIPAGTYSYKSTVRWDNARGELERSTTATGAQATPAGASKIDFTIPNLHVTHKRAPRSNPAIEIWRTEVDPTEDAPFYLVTSKDPAVLAGDNRYVANDPAASFALDGLDNFTDDVLRTKEMNPENGGVLENLAPPAATIITANSDRLFLAGVANDPNRIWYSKQRGDNEVAAFHDTLTLPLSPTGGDITALAFMHETLVVFKETAIFVVGGDGFDNAGGGQNLGPARLVTTDVGATNHEAVAVTPMGIIFKSAKGWFALDGAFQVQYIGGAIADYDSEAVVGMQVLESEHELRIYTASRVLFYDIVAKQWGERTIEGARGCTMWRGVPVFNDNGSAFQDSETLTGLTHGIDVEFAWFKPNELMGGVRCRAIQLLGEYRSACRVRTRIAYDYQAAYVDDEYWTASPTVVGDELNVRISLSRQQFRAIKVRITLESTSADEEPPSGEGAKLTAIAFEVGMRRGLNKRLPSAQKV